MRTVASAALATLLAACGSGATETTTPEARGPVDANVRLYVSNQSFERSTVDIRVEIDGETLVDDEFDVEGQHSWHEFRIELERGKHVLRATSEDGDATLERTFRVRGRQWVVLNYWCCDDPREPRFTLEVSRRPVAFG